MKKSLLCLLLALLCTASIQAQGITSLSQIKPDKKYLLQNSNGYGYAIFNPILSDKDVMLGGAEVIHSMGCNNPLYMDPVNPTDPNNQWKITSAGNNTFYFYNLGAKQYLTNAYTGWDFWSQTETREYSSFFFTDEQEPIDIIPAEEGTWAIRLTSAAYASNADKQFLCAASHAYQPMANWTFEDVGSTWYIKEVIEELATSITLSQTNLTLTVGSTINLTATVKPSTAPGASLIEWTTDNEDVATVSNGTVTAVKPGTCQITATVKDGSNLKATCSVTVQKDDGESLGTLRYFTLHDGQLIVIPEKYIEKRTEEKGMLRLTLTGDTTIVIVKEKLANESTQYQGDLPVFESFKFNNKFNDQLQIDADGVIDNTNNTIDLSVGCIGKRLTPSFKVPEGAHAYVNNEEQHSKVTRLRFDDEITYTLAYPKNWIYTVQKISDPVWSTAPEDTNDPWILTSIELTSSMISTNWPSDQSDQKLSNILDGDITTYFHSNWSASNNWNDGSYYGDGHTTWPYLQIDLAQPIENFQFDYTTRDWETNGGYAPQGFIIQASQNGQTWNEICVMDKEKYNLPVGASQAYSSPVISLGNAYKHIRLQLTESTRKNYLVLSEFSMSKATPNPDYGKTAEDFTPEIIVPAVYEHGFKPYGRDYKVRVDFLTDHPKAEYGVPRIDITFADGQSWNGNNWIGRYGKEYWEDATIKIDGAGVYPNMEEQSILIRGRGNSSWSGNYTSKNPYRIKFGEKMKPFGLTKGKNWVLLANKQNNSMTTNAIAMKIADMVESAACNHIIPVELYVNGQYRGSYNFTEKIGFAGNSISVEDETNAALVELDSYYDEAYRFKSKPFTLPVNIKSPDFTDPEELTNLTFEDIQISFNNMAANIKDGVFEGSLDIDKLCRAMLVTDLTRNTETQHPKSWYVYNENVLDDSPWVFGPVWDFDWSYGYEGSSTYFINDAERSLLSYSNTGNTFFKAVWENSDAVKKQYYRLWTDFLKRDCLGELVEFCSDYYNYVKPSFEHNATKWGDGKNYKTTTANAKNWLTKRANWIYTHLTPYDLNDDVIGDEEDFDYGQPDRIDVAQTINTPVDVFTLQGVRVRTHVPYIKFYEGLMPGIYVVNGKKVMVK